MVGKELDIWGKTEPQLQLHSVHWDVVIAPIFTKKICHGDCREGMAELFRGVVTDQEYIVYGRIKDSFEVCCFVN